MPFVILKNSNQKIEVPEDMPLAPYLMDTGGIVFGCTKGECGTCVCTIVKGKENANKPTQKEEKTLNQIGAHPSQRLACQIRILKGEVTLE